MIVHDIIKINLSRAGYLPDYPPHLISDAEMCNAFLAYTGENTEGKLDWFHDNYPVPEGLESEYAELETYISNLLQTYVQSDEPDAELPDWIYAYMMGSVIGPNSDVEDRHNMLVLMGMDNKDDEITPEVCRMCYNVSKQWIVKYGSDRPAGMFIEPHIVKYYRLRAAI